MPDANALSEYLGEGVHARFDPTGNQIWLIVERAREEPSIEPHGMHIERVALEPQVFDALVAFACRCWPNEEAQIAT